jgi:poly(hydroxyalkanoate) granule-associated protein
MATKTKPASEEIVKETKEAVEANNGKERNALLEASRKVLLAGIGAVALAQDEIEDFINRLIERGEIAEKDGRKLMSEVMDRRKKTTHDAEEKMSKQVEEILDRLNVPTKGDIETLSEKIATLTKKVDELKKDKTPA